MKGGKSGDVVDDALVDKLEAAQYERARARRHSIEDQVAAGEHGDRSVKVGLKAFHGICDHWAIDQKDAKAILGSDSKENGDTAELLERIHYVMRIYRLIIEVVQGDQARQQRWIRRSIASLDGQRPIDLMKSGPIDSARVLEYLEYYKYGSSS